MSADETGVVELFRFAYLSSGRFRLTAPYVYRWEKDGEEYRLCIPEGFECDMASVPRPLRWLIDQFGLKSAALPHDYLYRLGGRLPEGVYQRRVGGEWVDDSTVWTREATDRLFGRQMREQGVDSLERRLAYLAVRLFGRWAWEG